MVCLEISVGKRHIHTQPAHEYVSIDVLCKYSIVCHVYVSRQGQAERDVLRQSPSFPLPSGTSPWQLLSEHEMLDGQPGGYDGFGASMLQGQPRLDGLLQAAAPAPVVAP